jgi:hypothetical protein
MYVLQDLRVVVQLLIYPVAQTATLKYNLFHGTTTVSTSV